jgi:hypothetical protein
MSDKWERHWVFFRADVHRTGLLGVWDALKAWFMGRDRITVPTDMTCSLYVKGDAEIDVWGAYIEHGRGITKLEGDSEE